MTEPPVPYGHMSRSLLFHGRRAARTFRHYHGNPTHILRDYAFSALPKLGPMVVVERDNIRYLISTTDLVSRQVFVFGHFERDLMAATLRLIGDLSGQHKFLKGKTFLDVGANLGTSTISALLAFGAGRAIGFEPAPANYAILCCNLILNGLDGIVDTYPVAVTDHDGEDVLELSAENSGDHRVRTPGPLPADAFSEGTRDTVTVVAHRLDSLVQRGQIDLSAVGLLWADVQGHEAQVLAGASSLLSYHRPIPVVIEFWPYGLRRSHGLSRLCELVSQHFRSAIDVRASLRLKKTVILPADDLLELAETYGNLAFTDLILIR